MAAWAVDQAAGVLDVLRSFGAASSFTHASETEQKSQAGKQQTCGEKSLISTEWTWDPMISTMWWMRTESPEQVIKIQFTVQCNMSWNVAQIGWINLKVELYTLSYDNYGQYWLLSVNINHKNNYLIWNRFGTVWSTTHTLACVMFVVFSASAILLYRTLNMNFISRTAPRVTSQVCYHFIRQNYCHIYTQKLKGLNYHLLEIMTEIYYFIYYNLLYL